MVRNVDTQCIVELASELIRFGCIEAERINRCAQYCRQWLADRGVDCELIEHEGLLSVVASVGEGDPVIVLNGHLDVVPGALEDYEPHVADGKLYGRGSYDMLGAVASMMVLMAELVKSPPPCKVMLALVPDEESGGELGTAHLVRLGFVGNIAICGEPTNLNIAVQAKGILQLVVEVPGVAAHGSRPWLGTNAIMEAMERFRAIASLHYFQESTPFFHQPSLNLAKIQAGQVFNQVPDCCTLGIDIRYLPGQCPESLVAAIRQAVGESQVRVHFHGPPVDTKADDKLVARLGLCAGTRFFGQDGSADTRFYAERGIPAVEFGPSGANHHGPGEYVDIASLAEYTRILHAFILQAKDDEA